MTRFRLSAGLVALAAVVCSCAKPEVAVVEVKGECADLFKAQVCTWAHTQGTTLVDVGATVPIASIENAGAPASMAWPPVADAVVRFPGSATTESGLTEMTAYWEADGHPPTPYMTPHWDFHFYTVPTADRIAIDCKDDAKPATLAAGYVLPDQDLPPDMAKMMGVSKLVGICVPGMGMHSLLGSELASTTPFRGSMVLGYYHTKPVFIEPMLTKAMLLEKKSFDLPIAEIPGLAGPYPRTFRATYDSTAQSYRFTFSGFAAGK